MYSPPKALPFLLSDNPLYALLLRFNSEAFSSEPFWTTKS
jgi:hypothetical protein